MVTAAQIRNSNLATRSRGNSGEILNEELLKPLGLHGKRACEGDWAGDGDGALCRNDRSTARRLYGAAGQGLVLLNRVNATDLSLLVRPLPASVGNPE